LVYAVRFKEVVYVLEMHRFRSISSVGGTPFLKELPQGKQREAEDSAPEVQVMTDALLFSPMHPREQMKCLTDMCQDDHR
jgi:hypothetical protein